MLWDRQPCIVPFCGRTTTKQPYSEWICREHWRLTSRITRLRFFRARRRGEERKQMAIWAELKRQAIERAAGLS